MPGSLFGRRREMRRTEPINGESTSIFPPLQGHASPTPISAAAWLVRRCLHMAFPPSIGISISGRIDSPPVMAFRPRDCHLPKAR